MFRENSNQWKAVLILLLLYPQMSPRYVYRSRFHGGGGMLVFVDVLSHKQMVKSGASI
jgi:hypothetical protein